jgi:AhpD family alkylhydroperoxidase
VSWIGVPAERDRPWHMRALLRLLGRRGRLTQSVRLWARAPRAIVPFLGLYQAVDGRGSPLDPALRALVMTRVSQVDDCPFCVDLNGAHALARGATREQLAALPQHAASPLFGPREKAALAFADAVSAHRDTSGAVSAEVRAALRAAFSEDEIVALAALVAFQNMSAKFNFALDVPAEGFCDLPRRPAASPEDG